MAWEGKRPWDQGCAVLKLFVRSKIDIFNIYPKRRGEAVAYERLPQSDCKYTAVIRQRLEMPHLSIV